MPLLQWSSSFSVKIPELDQQHRRLVDMLNRLYDALRSGGDETVARTIVEELLVYSKHHFATEERLMELTGYSGLEEHRRKHRAMESQVKKFQAEVAEGGTTVQLRLMNFLRDWLQKHILETDMQYSSHLSTHLPTAVRDQG